MCHALHPKGDKNGVQLQGLSSRGMGPQEAVLVETANHEGIENEGGVMEHRNIEVDTRIKQKEFLGSIKKQVYKERFTSRHVVLVTDSGLVVIAECEPPRKKGGGWWRHHRLEETRMGGR